MEIKHLDFFQTCYVRPLEKMLPYFETWTQIAWDEIYLLHRLLGILIIFRPQPFTSKLKGKSEVSLLQYKLPRYHYDSPMILRLSTLVIKSESFKNNPWFLSDDSRHCSWPLYNKTQHLMDDSLSGFINSFQSNNH